MSVDLSRFDTPGCSCVVERQFHYLGHHVVIVSLSYESDGSQERHMYCECDNLVDGKPAGRARGCHARFKVCSIIRNDAKHLHGYRWKEMGLEEAIVDVLTRKEAGEYFGQPSPEAMTRSDIGQLLGRVFPDSDSDDFSDVCKHLVQTGRVVMIDRILSLYKPHFHLPRQFKSLLAIMVEAPLGWPNGQMGLVNVERFENRMMAMFGHQDGKAVFGEEQYPEIDGELFADMVCDTLAQDFTAAANCTRERESFKDSGPDLYLKVLEQDIGDRLPQAALVVSAHYLVELVRVGFLTVDIARANATHQSSENNADNVVFSESEALRSVASDFREFADVLRANWQSKNL